MEWTPFCHCACLTTVRMSTVLHSFRMSVRDLVEQVKVQEKLVGVLHEELRRCALLRVNAQWCVCVCVPQDQAARYNVSVKGAGHKGVRRVSLDTKLSSMNLDSNSTIMLTVAQRSAS